MQINKDFEELFESLNKNNVRYLVVGGYAYSIDAVNFEDAWKNKTNAYYGKQEITIIGKKDLITNKEATGREQDKLDAKRLHKV